MIAHVLALLANIYRKSGKPLYQTTDFLPDFEKSSRPLVSEKEIEQNILAQLGIPTED